jgi:glutathione peroxidase-family protein
MYLLTVFRPKGDSQNELINDKDSAIDSFNLFFNLLKFLVDNDPNIISKYNVKFKVNNGNNFVNLSLSEVQLKELK